MADLSRGAVFAGHRIEGIAGRGGMGTVYRATHLALDHLVALKVIAVDLNEDPTFRERFKSESRIAVSLRHPNVVPIHHAGEEDGLLFVTMDLIDGPDLRKLLIARGPLEPEQAVSILQQVASALDVAHSRGLVHRDIKPGNVLIEEHEGGDDHAYLTDFGLTKRIDQGASAALTSTGAFVGTLDYVAPEQIRGDELDARTDVYALGCVLHEMLTASPPFSGREEKVAKMYAHLQDDPEPLLGRNKVFNDVVLRALAKQQDDRFPSAGDLARAAAAALEGRDVETAERNVGTGAAAPTEQHQTPQEMRAPPPPDPVAPVESPPPFGETQPAEPVFDDTEPSQPGPPPRESDADSRETVASDAAPTREAAAAAERPESPMRAARTEKTPTPAGPRRSKVPLIVAGAAIVALVAGGFALLGGGDEGGGDASTPSLVDGAIPGGALPVGVAASDDDVYIADRGGERLIRANASTMEDEARFTTDGQPEDVVVEGDQVFVSVPSADEVQVLDRDFSSSGGSFAVNLPSGSEPMGITPADGYVWVAGSASRAVYRIDPDSPSDYKAFDVGAEFPFGIAVNGEDLWVVDREGGDVIRFDTKTEDRKTIDVGSNPKGIAIAGGSAYVANTDDGTVSVIDTETEKVTATARVDGQPRAVDVLGNRVWVSNGDSEANVEAKGGDGWVDYFDAGSEEPAGEVVVGGSPEGLGVSSDRIWVATGTGRVVKAIAP